MITTAMIAANITVLTAPKAAGALLLRHDGSVQDAICQRYLMGC
ncbi:hypothetical protein [Candidatus Litorirhabdus singularis]|jgi:hypothetical protein|nr:hypothetical protein [Candidatus Litorirhabdus singularis]